MVLVCASLKGKPKRTHEHGEREMPRWSQWSWGERHAESCQIGLIVWVVWECVHDMDAPMEQLYKVCRRCEREREREREFVCWKRVYPHGEVCIERIPLGEGGVVE